MTIGVHNPIREHLPRPSGRALVGGALVAVLAICLLDGAIAVWATNTAQAQLSPREAAAMDTYSLPKHLLAMVCLGLYAVWVACALIRERQPVLGMAVLLGVAAGPMSILAAPVSLSLLTTTSQATIWWWHLVVQSGQLLILVLWTVWTTLCIKGRRIIESDPVQADQTHGAIPSSLLFMAYAAVSFTAQVLSATNNGLDSPGILPIIGWAVLGAGTAVIVVQSSWWAMSGFVFVGGVLMLGMLYEAYYREGAWEGVAGWESGAQSPLILSLGASACVLAGPLLGAMLRRRHPPAGAKTEPPVEDPIIRNAGL